MTTARTRMSQGILHGFPLPSVAAFRNNWYEFSIVWRQREIYLPLKTISITQKENTINVS